MDCPWETVEVWCQRCEKGYDVTESRSPREPARTVLILSKKGEPTERAGR